MIINVATVATNNENISVTAMWVMLAFAIILLFAAAAFIYAYIRYKRNKTFRDNSFNTYTNKTRIFEFWINITFIFLIFVSIVGSIVLWVLFGTAI